MIVRYKSTLFYGIILALLLFILRWLEIRFLILQHSFEIYAGAIALLFTALGVWLALKLSKPKVVEKQIYMKVSTEFVFNEVEFVKLGLSSRELEVLQLMAAGKSNQEIADHLFLSLNTIKTHSSKLFEKLEVKRRTQAIELGKKLALIP